jgi:hypothetical protein
MHQVNQARAYGFLLGGSSVPSSVVQQFNTLHSCSQANAPTLHLSQIFHCLSSPLSSDEDDNHLMKMITCSQCNRQQFVVRYLAFFNAENHEIFKNAREFCRCIYLLYSHVHNPKLILYIAKSLYELQ